MDTFEVVMGLVICPLHYSIQVNSNEDEASAERHVCCCIYRGLKDKFSAEIEIFSCNQNIYVLASVNISKCELAHCLAPSSYL
jgi:hypothetical protein